MGALYDAGNVEKGGHKPARHKIRTGKTWAGTRSGQAQDLPLHKGTWNRLSSTYWPRVAVIGTILAITEKHPVHAILYLVTSLFAMAVIFYLLMAPLVAVFEVIIYAGAIMVLFLFVIMMLDLGHPEKGFSPHWREWLPAMLLSLVSIASLVAVIVSRHRRRCFFRAAHADPRGGPHPVSGAWPGGGADLAATAVCPGRSAVFGETKCAFARPSTTSPTGRRAEGEEKSP